MEYKDFNTTNLDEAEYIESHVKIKKEDHPEFVKWSDFDRHHYYIVSLDHDVLRNASTDIVNQFGITSEGNVELLELPSDGILEIREHNGDTYHQFMPLDVISKLANAQNRHVTHEFKDGRKYPDSMLEEPTSEYFYYACNIQHCTLCNQDGSNCVTTDLSRRTMHEECFLHYQEFLHNLLETYNKEIMSYYI